jgi:hypothetical protein
VPALLPIPVGTRSRRLAGAGSEPKRSCQGCGAKPVTSSNQLPYPPIGSPQLPSVERSLHPHPGCPFEVPTDTSTPTSRTNHQQNAGSHGVRRRRRRLKRARTPRSPQASVVKTGTERSRRTGSQSALLCVLGVEHRGNSPDFPAPSGRADYVAIAASRSAQALSPTGSSPTNSGSSGAAERPRRASSVGRRRMFGRPGDDGCLEAEVLLVRRPGGGGARLARPGAHDAAH